MMQANMFGQQDDDDDNCVVSGFFGTYNVLINGWMFCGGHGQEWCHFCTTDHRACNNGQFEDDLTRAQYGILTDYGRIDLADRQQLGVAGKWMRLPNGKVACSGHRIIGCRACFNFKQQLLQQAATTRIGDTRVRQPQHRPGAANGPRSGPSAFPATPSAPANTSGRGNAMGRGNVLGRGNGRSAADTGNWRPGPQQPVQQQQQQPATATGSQTGASAGLLSRGPVAAAAAAAAGAGAGAAGAPAAAQPAPPPPPPKGRSPAAAGSLSTGALGRPAAAAPTASTVAPSAQTPAPTAAAATRATVTSVQPTCHTAAPAAAAAAATAPAAAKAAAPTAVPPDGTVVRGKKECWRCGAQKGQPGVTLMKCGGCHRAKYCSKDCQVKHFKAHRNQCSQWGEQL